MVEDSIWGRKDEILEKRSTRTVIDFEFADDDDQNPGPSAQHLVRMGQKRERTANALSSGLSKSPRMMGKDSQAADAVRG